jgi:hypothetical protein
MDQGSQNRGSGLVIRYLIKSKKRIIRPEREIAAGQGVRGPRIIQSAIAQLMRAIGASSREMDEADDNIIGIAEVCKNVGPVDSTDSTRLDIDQGQSRRTNWSCRCWKCRLGYAANFTETVEVE